MSSNSIGKHFRLTTFGESHGKAIGGIIEGCPPNVELNFKFIQDELNRRKPGQSKIVSQRKEEDQVEFLSGIFEGKTTGMPIGFLIYNKDQKSGDYSEIKDKFRPNHADFTYQLKYGIRDYRGGGRSSARETASWVVAGSIAKQLFSELKINAFVSQVGDIVLSKKYDELDFSKIEESIVRCPDVETSKKMENLILKIKKEGNTIGGVITCVIKNVPIGLGDPVFEKLQAQLAKAMLSINAVKGFEYGSGFQSACMRGSEHNDIFDENLKTNSNNSGGIQGGISNGMDIVFKVAFKPVATILQSQVTIDEKFNKTILSPKGRHDPCVVPRAVVVVEALAAIVLLNAKFNNKILNS